MPPLTRRPHRPKRKRKRRRLSKTRTPQDRTAQKRGPGNNAKGRNDMAAGKEKRSRTAHRTPAQIRKHGKTYQATPAQKKKRAKRNAARAAVVKKRGATAVRGKDVGHKKPLSKGGTNAAENLKVQSKSKNRGHGMTRGKKANKGK